MKYSFYALLALCSCCSIPLATARELTDGEVAAFQAERFNKAEYLGKTIVLGTHHGNKLIAEHPCSDLCPNYTVRIVHYDVAIERCLSVGGRMVDRSVPVGIATAVDRFCVPPILDRPNEKSPNCRFNTDVQCFAPHAG